MELNKIYELMSEFKKSGIAKMKISDGDFSISLEMPEVHINKLAMSETHAPHNVQGIPDQEKPAETGEFIRSPIVGTFYEAPGAGMDPFVNIGQTVKKGENVCIIEAMKMMNEISAPYDCLIEEVMVENETAVGYDQPLFRIRGL